MTQDTKPRTIRYFKIWSLNYWKALLDAGFAFLLNIKSIGRA